MFPLRLHRLLQCCRDDSLNVTVPMRMLEIFSSEKTYQPVISDASCVTSLLEQILHYMVQKGNTRVRSLFPSLRMCQYGWPDVCLAVLSIAAKYLHISAA